MDLSKDDITSIKDVMESDEGKEWKNDRGFTIVVPLSNLSIRIKCNEDKIPHKFYFRGSLSKFYFGNNLKALDRESTMKAIKEISDNLGVDFRKAILTRVDIGVNIELEHPIHKYIECLKSYPRLEYCRYKDSVTFFTKYSSKSLIFYDKIKEIKNKDKDLYRTFSKEIRNKNIIRYEIRLRRNLKYHLKKRKIKVRTLYNKNTWNMLLGKWDNGYDKVMKFESLNEPLFLLKEYNGVLKYLASCGLSYVGYDKVINSISDLTFDVKNPRSKRSKMKYVVNSILLESNKNSLEKSLVKELDDKINILNVYNYIN